MDSALEQVEGAGGNIDGRMNNSIAGSRDAAVRFDDLGHAYHPGRWVFRNYAARIERGRVFAVLGPNGRGKSTLLHLLLRDMLPTEGTIEVKGSAAFVPQLFDVSFDYSALDMVLMGRARQVGLFSQPSRLDREAALAALDRFRIGHFADSPFHELSGGERQLVIFARALVSESDILFLDEPTSSLDLRNQALVLDWIRRLSRDDGLTIVFTTHHPHHVSAVADDVFLMMEQGCICGPSDSVLTETNLTALYGVPVKRVSFVHDGRTIETIAPVLDSAQLSAPPQDPA